MRKVALASVALVAVTVFGATSLAQVGPGARRTTRASAQTIILTGRVREVLLSTTCKDVVRPRPLPCQLVFLGIEYAQGQRQLVYAVDTYTGHPSRDLYTMHATNTSYNADGTLSARYTGGHRVRRNGTTFAFGQGSLTGGTGLYRGITGTLSYTGSNPSNARVTVYKYRVKITTP